MVDITIKGAGILGLSIAWECLNRGARVQVIDPYGVASGASGGIVGALAPHVPENWNEKKAFQLASLLAAPLFWQTVDAASGLPSGYGRVGRLQPILDERALTLAQQRSLTAQALWKEDAKWNLVKADPTNPWHPKSPTGTLIFDTLSARLHPKQACHSLAKAVRSKGGVIITKGTDQGMVCHATGWSGLVGLSNELGRKVGDGVKGQAVLLKHDAANLPQLFVDGLHIIGHMDATVAIGSTSERDFIDPYQTDSAATDLLDRAISAVPILKDAKIVSIWAGVRPRAKSRAPLIGRHPITKNHFIANGGFKIGFGMAPKIAECMANLMLAGHAEIPESFDSEVQLT